ncbi:MAG TPA: ferrous iron transport protein B [Elusimicrobiota bacterium]|nr:ferrous iron transport protein B [Elusimicrobiota bacterium]
MTDGLTEIGKIRGHAEFVIALAGNPNVGKSTLFNELTGLGSMTANYPGKTVSLNVGSSSHGGFNFGVIDLPGTYALGSVSEDQAVARRAILEKQADVVVAVVDATNLERNLYLVLQLIDLEVPLVVACNLMDIASRQGIRVDTPRLAELLGVRVIPMTATRGEGITDLIRACRAVALKKEHPLPLLPVYEEGLSGAIKELSDFIGRERFSPPDGLSPRSLAVLLLEEDEEFLARLRGEAGKRVAATVGEIGAVIERRSGEKSGLRVVRERHRFAHHLSRLVIRKNSLDAPLSTTFWGWTMDPVKGLPILIGGLLAVFMLMYHVGGFLSAMFDLFWTTVISPHLRDLVTSLWGVGVLSKSVLWGVDAGLQAAFSVGIPYVLVFYGVLAVLEDSGYLNSVAFLSDSLMTKIGLHGKSVIPFMAGAGCNVPAIVGTRILSNRREKIIACTLITLVPCSARTAIIMGAVAFFLGWAWALMVYLIIFAVTLTVGRLMAVMLPGQSSGMIMEVFPFRMPRAKILFRKTWVRFREFIVLAVPMIVVGSIVLGWLYESEYMWFLTKPLSLVVHDWLGLPEVAGICLLFGILRKELALQLLLALAIIQQGPHIQNLLSFMTKQQIFVFALVASLYVPCLAAVSALVKELGWKSAGMIAVFTIVVAVLVGGTANQVLTLFHPWLF